MRKSTRSNTGPGNTALAFYLGRAGGALEVDGHRIVAAAVRQAGGELPAIAHNKVLVIDDATIITGSFNFTRAAQERNAENVLVIHGDREIARRYAENWRSRARVSVPYSR